MTVLIGRARRLDLAKSLGCDAVEPDQNNPVGNNPGFPITLAEQKAWYLEVARQAHLRGLSVGMKNGIETVDADTVAAFDGRSTRSASSTASAT